MSFTDSKKIHIRRDDFRLLCGPKVKVNRRKYLRRANTNGDYLYTHVELWPNKDEICRICLKLYRKGKIST